MPLKIQGVSLSFPILIGTNVLFQLLLVSEFIIKLIMFWILKGTALILTSRLSRCFLCPLLLWQVHVYRSGCRKIRFCQNHSWNICRRNRVQFFEVKNRSENYYVVVGNFIVKRNKIN